MRKFAAMLAATIAAMLAVPKMVYEGGRWVLRAMFAPPAPAGLEVEEAMDAVRAAAAPTPAPSEPARDAVQAADAVRKASLAEAADAVREWGRLARAYATSRLSAEPEPDLRALDEAAESWLRSLSDEECRRLLDFGVQRVSDHLLGAHPIPGLSRCQQYPAWAPAVLLADAPGRRALRRRPGRPRPRSRERPRLPRRRLSPPPGTDKARPPGGGGPFLCLRTPASACRAWDAISVLWLAPCTLCRAHTC